MAEGPYRDGRVHVAAERCSTCIYRPGNLMRLEPGRRAQMQREALANDSAITCHSTLDGDEQAVCRGFFDAFAPASASLRLAVVLDVVQEVQV